MRYLFMAPDPRPVKAWLLETPLDALTASYWHRGAGVPNVADSRTGSRTRHTIEVRFASARAFQRCGGVPHHRLFAADDLVSMSKGGNFRRGAFRIAAILSLLSRARSSTRILARWLTLRTAHPRVCGNTTCCVCPRESASMQSAHKESGRLRCSRDDQRQD